MFNDQGHAGARCCHPRHNADAYRAPVPSACDIPPALTWLANIDNPQTRRAYQNDVQEFMTFTGIEDPHAFRQVGCGHVLAWRERSGWNSCTQMYAKRVWF